MVFYSVKNCLRSLVQVNLTLLSGHEIIVFTSYRVMEKQNSLRHRIRSWPATHSWLCYLLLIMTISHNISINSVLGGLKAKKHNFCSHICVQIKQEPCPNQKIWNTLRIQKWLLYLCQLQLYLTFSIGRTYWDIQSYTFSSSWENPMQNETLTSCALIPTQIVQPKSKHYHIFVFFLRYPTECSFVCCFCNKS